MTSEVPEPNEIEFCDVEDASGDGSSWRVSIFHVRKPWNLYTVIAVHDATGCTFNAHTENLPGREPKTLAAVRESAQRTATVIAGKWTDFDWRKHATQK